MISITGTWFLIEALLSDNQISISSAPVIPVVARESVPLSADGLAPPQLNLTGPLKSPNNASRA